MAVMLGAFKPLRRHIVVKRFFISAVLLLPVLAACGGGSTPNTLVPASNLIASPNVKARALSEAQSDAIQRPQPQYTPSTSDLLYVGNVGNNSITVYRHDASGNTSPLKVIAGPKTGISSPGALSEDSQGDLYVANGFFDGPSATPAILVFAKGANGNVAPIRKLAGPLTGIHNVAAITAVS